MDLYRELVLDHYKHPRNFGHLGKPDVVVEKGNVTCGDRIVMELAFSPQTLRPTTQSPRPKTLECISFSGEGCAISQASASMLTEKVKGMELADIMDLETDDIVRMLQTQLTPSRIQCAVLPLEVLQKGIVQIMTKRA